MLWSWDMKLFKKSFIFPQAVDLKHQQTDCHQAVTFLLHLLTFLLLHHLTLNTLLLLRHFRLLFHLLLLFLLLLLLLLLLLPLPRLPLHHRPLPPFLWPSLQLHLLRRRSRSQVRRRCQQTQRLQLHLLKVVSSLSCFSPNEILFL